MVMSILLVTPALAGILSNRDDSKCYVNEVLYPVRCLRFSARRMAVSFGFFRDDVLPSSRLGDLHGFGRIESSE